MSSKKWTHFLYIFLFVLKIFFYVCTCTRLWAWRSVCICHGIHMQVRGQLLVLVPLSISRHPIVCCLGCVCCAAVHARLACPQISENSPVSTTHYKHGITDIIHRFWRFDLYNKYCIQSPIFSAWVVFFFKTVNEVLHLWYRQYKVFLYYKGFVVKGTVGVATDNFIVRKTQGQCQIITKVESVSLAEMSVAQFS